MTRVAMLGASGRMGRAIVALLVESDDLSLSGALAAADDPRIGEDAGVVAGVAPLGVPLTGDAGKAMDGAEVAIDFTLPGASLHHARQCAERSLPIVIGTTGHDAPASSAIEDLARRIAVVMAPNMSPGVNLVFKLAELAARALDVSYDAEIFEAHHRHKVDAPSGTALGLGRAVARGRGSTLEQLGVYSRHGTTGPRPPGAIGFSVVRGGEIVGEHRVIFAGPGERIELVHEAQDRSGFARGALLAVRWIAGRPPGLYSMFDVLGL
jgi:4-hydroxy-tetrahydrodipicolinate reductase